MNIDLWLQTKLSGDWSAQAAASGLTEERLGQLTRMFGGLDSMVKVRLLLAGMFVPRADRGRLQPLLSELSSQAASSQDEWVRATAAAVGDFSGPLGMRTLMAQFPLVRDTMTSLSAQLEGVETPAALLPQAEQYMHRDISRLPATGLAGGAGSSTASGGAGQGPQFRLRDPPAMPLVDFGLSAHLGGGQGARLVPGMGSGSLDTRLPVSLSGSGADPMARRGLGGGETLMLRSRADVSHSTAFKDAKQAPPTPKGGGAVAAALPLRLSRARSTAGPDGAVLESPHQHAAVASLAPPGAALHGLSGSSAVHGAHPAGSALGRRDSQGLHQLTPRFGAQHMIPIPPSAATPFDSGGGFQHHPSVHATSTSEPPAFTGSAAGHPEVSSLHQHVMGPTDQLNGGVQLHAGQEASEGAGVADAGTSAGWPGHATAELRAPQTEGFAQSASAEASEDGGDDEPEAKRARGFA